MVLKNGVQAVRNNGFYIIKMEGDSPIKKINKKIEGDLKIELEFYKLMEQFSAPKIEFFFFREKFGGRKSSLRSTSRISNWLIDALYVAKPRKM